MDDEELHDIAEIMVSRKFVKNQSVLLEDDTGSRLMFIIIKGKVKVSVTSLGGKETILAMLGEGDYFGEMSLIDGEPRSASVMTLEPSEIMIIQRGDLMDLLESKPRLALSMLVEFSRRLRAADRQISNLSMLSVAGKVAGTLLRIAGSMGKKEGQLWVVEKMPTHQEIASMSGTTRETVTRVLATLSDRGLLHIDKKKLTIIDTGELEETG